MTLDSTILSTVRHTNPNNIVDVKSAFVFNQTVDNYLVQQLRAIMPNATTTPQDFLLYVAWLRGLMQNNAIVPKDVTAGSTKVVLGGNPNGASLKDFSIDIDPTQISINDLSGVLDIIKGGTGLSTIGTAGQLIRVNSLGTALEYFTASTGGTVTSVGLTMPTAFTVTNSPVTTSGTIAVTGAGTTAQYVRGDGTLATFPSVGSGTVTSVAALTLGTSGTDLSSTVANSTTTPVITLNVPTASASNRGALSAADWTTFSNKQNALTPAALTKTDDTNVTLTLGGTPTTALLQATSLTLGWTGQLGIARGGTGLGTLGTANQLLRVNAGATSLEYFTPTYGSGTVTSIATAGLISGGTITSTGTITTSVSTNKLVGRATAGTGVMEEITLGTGLSFTGTTLNATGGGLTIGTTAITSGTVGRILYEGTGNVLQESANLFWDNSNTRLNIGAVASPTGTVTIKSPATTGIALQIRNNADTGDRLTLNGNGLLTLTGTLNSLSAFDSGFASSGYYIGTSGSISASNSYVWWVPGSGINVICNGSTPAASINLRQQFSSNALQINNYNDSFRVTHAGWASTWQLHGVNGNWGMSTGTVAAAATRGVFFIESGTAPTTSPTDIIQMYSADIVAGNAAPHFRTENGGIIKLYQQTTAVAAATLVSNLGTPLTSTDTFDGYTLLQIVKALRNSGQLA